MSDRHKVKRAYSSGYKKRQVADEKRKKIENIIAKTRPMTTFFEPELRDNESNAEKCIDKCNVTDDCSSNGIPKQLNECDSTNFMEINSSPSADDPGNATSSHHVLSNCNQENDTMTNLEKQVIFFY